MRFVQLSLSFQKIHHNCSIKGRDSYNPLLNEIT